MIQKVTCNTANVCLNIHSRNIPLFLTNVNPKFTNSFFPVWCTDSSTVWLHLWLVKLFVYVWSSTQSFHAEVVLYNKLVWACLLKMVACSFIFWGLNHNNQLKAKKKNTNKQTKTHKNAAIPSSSSYSPYWVIFLPSSCHRYCSRK